MKTNKTNHLIATTLTILFILVLTSCHPELEVAGCNYYYTINADSISYCLQNDKITMLTKDSPDNITQLTDKKGTRYNVHTYNDCYINGTNSYYIGNHQITEEWNDGAPDYNYHLDLIFSEAFIEVNGIRKTFQFPGKSEGLIIGYDNNDIYYVFRSTVKGENYMYETYYLSINGEEPTKIAEQQEEIYSIRKADIKKCKKHGDKLYFVGVKDNIGFYCEASNLRMPYYLSEHGGGAYDIAFKDSTILICGCNQGKACVWENGKPIDLEIPDYAAESEARALALVGEDLYVGGRTDQYPTIWKNGKIYATCFDFPIVESDYHLEGEVQSFDHKQIKEELGYVIDMLVDGDTIYSIVETSNFANDNKRCALEWYFNNGKFTYKSDYDLVELLKTGQIEMHPSFYGRVNMQGWVLWPRTYFGTPRIAPRYVKTKSKRKK